MKLIFLIIGLASIAAGIFGLLSNIENLSEGIYLSLMSFFLGAIFLRGYWMIKKTGELKL